MTLRLVNDDPRCQEKNDCHISPSAIEKGRGCCRECAGVARVDRMMEKAARRRVAWAPPAGFETDYIILMRMVGAASARTLIEEEARLKPRNVAST